MEKINIYTLTIDELRSKLDEIGIPKFNANIIFKWLYQKGVFEFDYMSDISKKNIETLKEKFYFPNLQIHKTFVDEEDDTTKFLFKLADGNLIEAVLMLFEFGNSICISSQIGCNMGCKFCASGLMKKIRNLEPYEYLLQYLKINDYLVKNKKMKVTNISFMGIGEPFDNYVNLSKAIKMLNDKNGINLGHRNMIVSTCGLIDKIVQFAYDFNQVKLAISLHASNDRTRSEIMPINKTYNLTKLFDAIEQWQSITNKQITIEYILLSNVNDSEENAKELINLLRNINCYLNIIQYNEVKETKFLTSKRAMNFKKMLENKGINVAIRQPRGKNLKAGCGQLRANEILG